MNLSSSFLALKGLAEKGEQGGGRQFSFGWSRAVSDEQRSIAWPFVPEMYVLAFFTRQKPSHAWQTRDGISDARHIGWIVDIDVSDLVIADSESPADEGIETLAKGPQPNRQQPALAQSSVRKN